jgi:hypothetical protein
LAIIVGKNLYDAVPDDEARDTFKSEPFLEKMIENKWLAIRPSREYYKKTKMPTARQSS